MEVWSQILGIAVNLVFIAGILLSVVKFVSENTELVDRIPWLQPIQPVVDRPTGQRIPYGKLLLFAAFVRISVLVVATLFCMIFQSENTFNQDFFANMWLRWDGSHYLSIAENGYSQPVEGDYLLLVFFPLYPWCIRLLHFIVGDYYLSGMIVSWACYAGAIIFLYKLLIIDFEEKTVWKTLVLISIFPFSFYFGSIHTESLSLMTMAIPFYYIRKHKWPLVMVFGILSALTRLVGSLVAVVAVMEYIRFYRPFHQLKQKQFGAFWKDIFTKFIFIPFIALGVLIYFGINYAVAGNPLQFQIYQISNWHNSAQLVFQTPAQLFERTFSSFNTLAGCIWIPELLLFLCAALLLIVTWRKIPSMYSVFLSVYVAISYGMSWLISGCRYMAIAFPMFLMAAIWCEKKPARYLACIIVSCLLLTLYLSAFLNGKQVM